MALERRTVERLVGKWRLRGRALAGQGRVAAELLRGAPVDLSGVIGPVLLLGQAMAKAQATGVAAAMADPGFAALPLDLQGTLAAEAVRWSELRGALGSMAFDRRLPTLGAVTVAGAAAASRGANAAGVAISSRLEALTNPAGVAGLTVETFWAVSSEGRVALGRLLAADLALTGEYDFDVLAEAEAALDGAAPLAPDPVALIRRVEAVRVPAFRDLPVVRAKMAVIPSGTDMPTLAKLLVGEAEAWRLLVAFNGLRYPYVSEDPLDQLGDPLGTRALAGPVLAGSTTIPLLDVTGLYPDQRLRFDAGDHAEEVTIKAVDATTATATLASPLAGKYLLDAVVTVYAPVYELLGRVLVPGETIQVPILAAGSDQAALGPPGRLALDADRVYGTDVAVTPQGRLSATAEGGLALVAGVGNLVQALRHRFAVPRGSLPHYPSYGSGLEAFIGFRDAPFWEFLAMVEARQTALRDPRIDHIGTFAARFSGDRLEVEMDAVTTSGEQFPALRVEAPVLRGG